MKCKYCGSENITEKSVTFKDESVHIELRCADCGKFQQYKKYVTDGKTKEDYRKEYYEKMNWKYTPKKEDK